MLAMESSGSATRIKKCAFDLLSIGDDLMDDADSWDLFRRDLTLKSTFLYCDFSQIISNAPKDQKKALTELGNKLFCSIEELDRAVKIQNISLTQDRYNDAAVILQEVMAIIP
ncbi:psbQ-like protein 2 chloroplastic [Tripterygium wilfordii]|uniref:PsbQ-like protein 2 chloroplastic n=1 Tax=Tripterygium wilfordii TaxID=458696 RepID=A0A7J7DUP7_TRIWF|nr:photosynthetic NDH subunit of lumenal location 3, chloroplastic-like [Tripterygium wilfordii]KAF5750023.1 psbQ-like protein 2 chloroplastic [Tripterygium wilfordii]